MKPIVADYIEARRRVRECKTHAARERNRIKVRRIWQAMTEAARREAIAATEAEPCG